MRKNLLSLLLSFSIVLPLCLIEAQADFTAPQPIKEWTFLTYINGNNSLDSYGATNINQMEQIGSTDSINIVVQWASLARKTAQRIYVRKDNKPSTVTSPVLQELKGVDMGDWRTLVDFIQWAHDHYPARHYFINVWDHGNGWHLKTFLAENPEVSPSDISWDDATGSFITTKQLGQVMQEAARIIGHKVDLYASDACLMAMVEIADEMSQSVEIFAGSQEVEPGEGWPYQTFLTQWTKKQDASAAEIAKMLTTEYAKSYSGGVNGSEDVTFSAYDMSKLAKLNQAIAILGTDIVKMNSTDRTKALQAAGLTLNFTNSDYADLGDYLVQLEKAKLASLAPETFSGIRSALKDFVIANQTTGRYKKATGVSIWLPTGRGTYATYAGKYAALRFQADTDWNSALKALVGN